MCRFAKKKVFMSRARFGKMDLEKELGLQQRTAVLRLWDWAFLWKVHGDVGVSFSEQIPFIGFTGLD